MDECALEYESMEIAASKRAGEERFSRRLMERVLAGRLRRGSGLGPFDYASAEIVVERSHAGNAESCGAVKFIALL